MIEIERQILELREDNKIPHSIEVGENYDWPGGIPDEYLGLPVHKSDVLIDNPPNVTYERDPVFEPRQMAMQDELVRELITERGKFERGESNELEYLDQKLARRKYPLPSQSLIPMDRKDRLIAACQGLFVTLQRKGGKDRYVVHKNEDIAQGIPLFLVDGRHVWYNEGWEEQVDSACFHEATKRLEGLKVLMEHSGVDEDSPYWRERLQDVRSTREELFETYGTRIEGIVKELW